MRQYVAIKTLLCNSYNTSMKFVLICKHDAQGRSVYKSDTNRMDVLQLLCFMVHEQIKGALRLCLA